MQARFTLANQGIEKFMERENKKKKVVIWMILRHTLVYIIDISLVFNRNSAIIKVRIFPEELSVLKHENCVCLLLRCVISSTGRRPASLCHGPLSVVRPSVRTYEPDIVGLGLG